MQVGLQSQFNTQDPIITTISGNNMQHLGLFSLNISSCTNVTVERQNK